MTVILHFPDPIRMRKQENLAGGDLFEITLILGLMLDYISQIVFPKICEIIIAECESTVTVSMTRSIGTNE